MKNKEIWTIDDIIEDYKIIGGISSRSKIDFLEDIKKKLEVLEILKKHCDFSLWDDMLNIFANEEYTIDYESGEYTSAEIPEEEDRKVIKEWLDE